MAVQYARKRVTSNTQNFRRFGNAQPKRDQAVLPNAVAGMRRTVHRHIAVSFLVVVNQVNIVDIAIVKAEYDPPVTGNRDTPNSLQSTFQRVKTVTGQIEIRGSAGIVKIRRRKCNVFRLIRAHSARVTTLVQPLEASIAKTSNHGAMYRMPVHASIKIS